MTANETIGTIHVMSRKSEAFTLRVLASEVEAGIPLSPRLSRALRMVEADPEVRAIVEEEIEDQRAVAQARREIARGVRTIPHEEVMRQLGLRR